MVMFYRVHSFSVVVVLFRTSQVAHVRRTGSYLCYGFFLSRALEAPTRLRRFKFVVFYTPASICLHIFLCFLTNRANEVE
jgi:hypothetical protein